MSRIWGQGLVRLHFTFYPRSNWWKAWKSECSYNNEVTSIGRLWPATRIWNGHLCGWRYRQEAAEQLNRSKTPTVSNRLPPFQVARTKTSLVHPTSVKRTSWWFPNQKLTLGRPLRQIKKTRTLGIHRPCNKGRAWWWWSRQRVWKCSSTWRTCCLISMSTRTF